MKLFPYQDKGAKWLYRNKVGLLADQPGLGKTAQAIMAAKHVEGLSWFYLKICVICPKAARENWRREFERWWPERDTENDMIVHFDVLALDTPERERFLSTPWDLIIIDEAHRLKTPGAKRTQSVYKHVHALKKRNPDFRCWLLTGTPAKNHAGELFTHLSVLRPDLIADRSGRCMTQEQFENKYCRVYNDAHGHRRIAGSKNIKELRDLMENGNFFLRRRKSEVQAELPELIFDEYPLATDKPVPRGMEALEGLSIDDALEYLKDHSKTLANWRHDVAQLKIPLVKDFVETELDTPGEKMIVFFHHTVMGRTLHHALGEYQPVIIDGQTKEAQDEVDTFNNDPNCRLLLGQISACQEALNMTAATQVAFAESAWSPSDNYQAACRAHRIGMQDSLVVRFLSVANSPDEIIARVLSRKAAELAELFD